MGKKNRIRVEVQGYGTVTVKIDKSLDEEKVADAVAEAVSKTCDLIIQPPARFHPVLGRVDG